MSSPSAASSISVEDLEREFVDFLTTSDAPFCCCHLFNANLSFDDHLNDCELYAQSADGPTPSNNVTNESRDDLQRRKHRETVARLRHQMRASIEELKTEERQLNQTLHNAIATTAFGASDAPRTLRHTYLELVREQIELQNERSQLESTQRLRERYMRLVERELEKARMFHFQENP